MFRWRARTYGRPLHAKQQRTKSHQKESEGHSSAERLPQGVENGHLDRLVPGVVAAAIFLWPVLFPVPKAQLVEVVWKHECSCASRWMDSLRAEGYTVRDFELDDTDTMRRQWRVPDSIQGCHPASYLGYFLDGHIPAAALRRLASERPQAIGLQRIDTVERGADGSEKLVPGELLLISGDGTATPWPPMQRGAKLP